MKTYNNHPQWHNQPLRLTEEQKQDTLSVFDDFFQCYHLSDVRQILWAWFTEVISSERSISIDPHDRNNHVYFYEKIEELIEAAYVMKRGQPGNIESVNTPAHFKSEAINPAAEDVDNGDVFNKSKQLLEYVDEDPMYVITQVFSEPLDFLRDQLRSWRHIALSADCFIYEEGEQRGQFLTFYDQLLELTEALFIIYTQKTEKSALPITEADKPRLLSMEQIADPMQVVANFFEKFSLEYIIRELNDWLEASILFTGTPPENMSKWNALNMYRYVLCLIKAANRL